MEKFKTVTETGTHEFLQALQYGVNPVQMDSFNSEVRIKRAAAAINAIYSMEAIKVVATEELSEWEDRPIYSVIWADKDNTPPVLTEDEINLPELAVMAAGFKNNRKLDISPKLKKYARKCAESQNISFVSNKDGFWFNGAPKKSALLSVIRQAHSEGLPFIELNAAEAEPQTVRVYVSQINNLLGTSFSVSVKRGKIKVLFVAQTAQEILTEAAVETFAGLRELIGHAAAAEVFAAIITPEEVTKVADSGQIEIIDPNVPAAAEVFAAEPNDEAEEEENTNFDYDAEGNKFGTGNEHEDDEDF